MSDADKAADCAGAGKTSVINTIFRLMELDQGGIYIDDVEVAKLGLAQLRNSMAIIPQVGSLPLPLLFLLPPLLGWQSLCKSALSVVCSHGSVTCSRHGCAIVTGMLIFGVTEVHCVQGAIIGHCF